MLDNERHRIDEGSPAAPTVSRGKAGGFSISEPDAMGVIRVEGFGFWTPDIVDRHFHDLYRIVADYRVRSRNFRMLVDLRKAAVNDSAVFDRLRAGTHHVYRPGDRVAVVVQSSLVKMQMRRLSHKADSAFFISINAAQMWLNAYA